MNCEEHCLPHIYFAWQLRLVLANVYLMCHILHSINNTCIMIYFAKARSSFVVKSVFSIRLIFPMINQHIIIVKSVIKRVEDTWRYIHIPSFLLVYLFYDKSKLYVFKYGYRHLGKIQVYAEVNVKWLKVKVAMMQLALTITGWLI